VAGLTNYSSVGLPGFMQLAKRERCGKQHVRVVMCTHVFVVLGCSQLGSDDIFSAENIIFALLKIFWAYPVT